MHDKAMPTAGLDDVPAVDDLGEHPVAVLSAVVLRAAREQSGESRLYFALRADVPAAVMDGAENGTRPAWALPYAEFAAVAGAISALNPWLRSLFETATACDLLLSRVLDGDQVFATEALTDGGSAGLGGGPTAVGDHWTASRRCAGGAAERESGDAGGIRARRMHGLGRRSWLSAGVSGHDGCQAPRQNCHRHPCPPWCGVDHTRGDPPVIIHIGRHGGINTDPSRPHDRISVQAIHDGVPMREPVVTMSGYLYRAAGTGSVSSPGSQGRGGTGAPDRHAGYGHPRSARGAGGHAPRVCRRRSRDGGGPVSEKRVSEMTDAEIRGLAAPRPVTYHEAESAYRSTIDARERFEELNHRDLMVRSLATLRARGEYDPQRHGPADKYEPLTPAERLELLAVGGVLARTTATPPTWITR